MVLNKNIEMNVVFMLLLCHIRYRNNGIKLNNRSCLYPDNIAKITPCQITYIVLFSVSALIAVFIRRIDARDKIILFPPVMLPISNTLFDKKMIVYINESYIENPILFKRLKKVIVTRIIRKIFKACCDFTGSANNEFTSFPEYIYIKYIRAFVRRNSH